MMKSSAALGAFVIALLSATSHAMNHAPHTPTETNIIFIAENVMLYKTEKGTIVEFSYYDQNKDIETVTTFDQKTGKYTAKSITITRGKTLSMQEVQLAKACALYNYMHDLYKSAQLTQQ